MKVRSKKNNDLRLLADELVETGLKKGADEIEVTIYDGRQFEVGVRLGQIETLVEADSKYCSIRVFKEKGKLLSAPLTSPVRLFILWWRKL